MHQSAVSSSKGVSLIAVSPARDYLCYLSLGRKVHIDDKGFRCTAYADICVSQSHDQGGL